MQLTFEAVAESRPGPKWQSWFRRNWPDYRAWFVSRDTRDHPSLATCMQQLRHMRVQHAQCYRAQDGHAASLWRRNQCRWLRSHGPWLSGRLSGIKLRRIK
jgi:hypothetical protein